MADSRALTYGLGFQAGDALNVIDQLEQGFSRVDKAEHQAQTGADELRSALNDIGSTAASVASEAGSAAQEIGGAFRDAGDDAGDRFRKMGADAESFGSAFRKTAAAAIKDGQSLAKSFQTGVGGAIAFTQKRFTTFRTDVTKGAKNITNAFKSPIQTIKGKLVEAFENAERGADEVGDKADRTGRDLEDMGNKGARAGDAIAKSLGNAVKVIAGFLAIKEVIGLLKDFVGGALNAAKATETVGAKFDRLFEGTNAEAWANNYADAVHRSTNEVKDFLVQNKAMFTEMGVTGDAATELSQITTSLAYDFGNAFKLEDAEALSLIQDAVKGNSGALSEFGINLDDATLKAEALKVGISAELDQLDDATKSQLRMNAILAQSSDIQKAAIEQTGGLVNSTKSLKGMWASFMEDAGAKFAPVMENFFGIIIEAWPRIEPMLMGLVDMLSEGLSQALPILTELGMTLFPILVDVLGTVFKVATPLIQVFGQIAGAVLPPLAEILAVLVDTLLPPLLSIFQAIVPIIETLMPVIKTIADAILPPIAQLLGLVAPILELISPVLEVIGNVLGIIAEVLGKVIGWLADGIGKVVGFFSNLFGGAKESKSEVEGLSTAVNGLDEATNKDITLSADTSSYASEISTASAEANAAAQDNIIETKDISDLNLQLMGAEAGSTYSTMAIDAETAWSRMTKAAEDGAAKIVAAFSKIASAAAGVGNANISVTGTSIPGHAGGTNDFEGGWTKINERGGELAFLPSGSAIVPADQSDRLMASATTNNTQNSPTFSPNITVPVTVMGNADDGTVEDLKAQLPDIIKRAIDDYRNDELTKMTLKNAYA